MRWPAQLLLVALIWGASFMFIKVELDAGIAPVHIAFLRCALGAPTLLLILVSRRTGSRATARSGATCSCSARS
jgi:drug/metabolite transporter (DMT)-like permease